MPLTNIGRKILKNFRDEYGNRKGNNLFYAYINKNPKKKGLFHIMTRTKTRRAMIR